MLTTYLIASIAIVVVAIVAYRMGHSMGWTEGRVKLREEIRNEEYEKTLEALKEQRLKNIESDIKRLNNSIIRPEKSEGDR